MTPPIKTHCKNGHAMSGDNLYVRKNKAGNIVRHCRKCRHAAQTAYRRGLGSKSWAERTHCSNGHLLTEANTYHPKGDTRRRVCRDCNKMWAKTRSDKRRAAGLPAHAPSKTPRKRRRSSILDILQPAELNERMQSLRDQGYDDMAARAIIATQIRESQG